jgi:chromosome segregation ATPase
MQIQGNDVSEEMVDLDARLKAKQATEARLLDLMKQAKEANDLIAIANRLDEVQSEIEQIKGRIQYLNNQVDYSTVTSTSSSTPSLQPPQKSHFCNK